MFRMYARNSHSHTHLILALGIVREPTVWIFMTSKYPGIYDIGPPTIGSPSKMSRVQRFDEAIKIILLGFQNDTQSWY